MWTTTIKTWSWVEIEGKTELKHCKIHFVFEKLEEAKDFIETVRTHSDIIEFELKYVAKGE